MNPVKHPTEHLVDPSDEMLISQAFGPRGAILLLRCVSQRARHVLSKLSTERHEATI